ncbi:asparaginase [Leucobacter sp. CSA1]|uniref:asparaginase n=1 Tax=Leucobacter chromiisoli TaxID=2796471 RepID=A0A934Q7I2_9MICO|nr:asparaginase domain-containing protein [Leucobacter chromiisoli]MBK0419715.1 asparaginase [Leucobacter chromiisoli]
MTPIGSQRPSVLVFATGGTIGMRQTDAGLAPDPDFPEILESLVDGICGPLGIDPRVNHLLPAIDSANADADTAPRIARTVRARVRTQQPRGVVILHGTDTLAFTAARLAFELSDLGAPVVVTGSQLPHGAPGSDAGANLALALRAAVRAALGAPVSIAFGGELLPAVRATKHDSVSPRAFRAEQPLAPRREGVSAPPDDRDRPSPARGPARVLSMRLVPSVTAEDLRAAVGGRPDGLVLECYGSGTAPTGRPGVPEALRAVCAEMPVVAVSQCAAGGVALGRYAVGAELARAGVIDGGDLTVEAALAKLGFLLDAGFEGAGLMAEMTRNLVGERTPAE